MKVRLGLAIGSSVALLLLAALWLPGREAPTFFLEGSARRKVDAHFQSMSWDARPNRFDADHLVSYLGDVHVVANFNRAGSLVGLGVFGRYGRPLNPLRVTELLGPEWEHSAQLVRRGDELLEVYLGSLP